ncbi:hypothetical protein CKY28_09765 [Sphingomonas lenta]|uniref:DUF177 domain-containing protein n=2 Tax=Sphingomonas lenta TaxID=1141887 RepID=A0A2A2SGL9_9SPHN|nr:hypothetical protein CKY28_09765 [Sphingomonas lenta]
MTATPDERAALAKRFDLVSIDRLRAHFAIRREAAGITARGRVEADLVQACSVTGEPVTTHVDEAAELLFVPEQEDAGDEVELSADALDSVPYTGDRIDLGEAAAETMALALDPFPRSPGAAAALREAGVLTEEEAKPLGPLAGLRDKLEGR